MVATESAMEPGLLGVVASERSEWRSAKLLGLRGGVRGSQSPMACGGVDEVAGQGTRGGGSFASQYISAGGVSMF